VLPPAGREILNQLAAVSAGSVPVGSLVMGRVPRYANELESAVFEYGTEELSTAQINSNT